MAEEFAERIPMTLSMLTGGGVLALVLSLAMGIAGAASSRGIVDRLLHGLALVGASTPNFFVAAMLVIVFSVWLGLVPTFGVSGLTSWLLPWITIALFPASVLARVVRVNLQDTMSRPFATTGFAKGLTRRAVLLREALPNIAIPYMTTFGAQFTLMIIGAIVVERVFGLNGVDAFFIGMQATLTLFVVLFVSVNLIVDQLAMLADPRLRRPRKA